MKKFCIVMAAVMLLLAVPFSTSATNTKIMVNGALVKFGQDDGVPFVEGGRTFVPVRAAAEAYGAAVDYDGEAREAIVVKDGITVRVPIGQSYIYRNGEKIMNDAPARIVNGRTYLPIRIVMEALGAKVGWDGSSSTVTVEDEDYMFIRAIETGAQARDVWGTWSKGIKLYESGDYAGAVTAYRSVCPGFLKEGKAVNNALVFMRLGDAYAAMGQYHNASLCYERSSYYWYQDPVYAKDQTALRYSILAQSVDCYMNVYLKTNDPAYNRTKQFGAPHEPESGILLGAFAQGDPVAMYSDEYYFTGVTNMTGKEHGLFLLYLHDDEDIRHYATHYERAIRLNSVMEIALEPTHGFYYLSDEKLIDMAQYMEASGCRFLLRYANEMNDPSCTNWYTDDPSEYIEAFRRVARIFKQYAPSVGLVWSPNYFPEDNITDYYPGDEYVDYVGLSVYEEIGDNANIDPLGQGVDRDRLVNILDYVYSLYGDRKPIIISEGGVGYHNIYTGADQTDAAARQLKEYYTYLPIKYPNLKMVVLFDKDEDAASSAGRYIREFLLSKNPVMLETYKQAVQSSARYIGRWNEKTDQYYYELFSNVSLPASYVELCGFVSSPVGNYDGVGYAINGAQVAESHDMPYTVGIDLSPYAGQTVELKMYTLGAEYMEKTINIQVQ